MPRHVARFLLASVPHQVWMCPQGHSHHASWRCKTVYILIQERDTRVLEGRRNYLFILVWGTMAVALSPWVVPMSTQSVRSCQFIDGWRSHATRTRQGRFCSILCDQSLPATFYSWHSKVTIKKISSWWHLYSRSVTQERKATRQATS